MDFAARHCPLLLFARLRLQVVYDFFLWQAKQGGAMAGACFWSAAVGGVSDDGYNICERMQ